MCLIMVEYTILDYQPKAGNASLTSSVTQCNYVVYHHGSTSIDRGQSIQSIQISYTFVTRQLLAVMCFLELRKLARTLRALLSSMESIDLALRVDIISEQDVITLVGCLDGLGGSYWIVREGGQDNPHLHVHLSTTTKLNAVRAAFKRRFPNHVGNGHYSIKQCDADVEGYDRYMAKGEGEGDQPVIIARQGLGFSLEAIKDWHKEYWCVNQELRKKRRKKLAGCMTDQLLQECLDRGIKSRGGIGIVYLELMKAAGKPINTFAGKATINSVWLCLDEGTEARDALLTDLVGAWAEDAIHQERSGVLK